MTVQRFEDLECWQRARILTAAIYRVSAEGVFRSDWGLQNQIRRAAVSVMSNIAEGFERGGDREFRQFLAQAKGSAGEVRAQLYVALDVGYISQQQFQDLSQQTEHIARQIAGLMRYLAQSNLKGNKFS